MKKTLFYILVIILTGASLMTINLASGQPSSAGDDVNMGYFLRNFCFDGKFDSMDSSDVMKEYVEKTNDFFNFNIQQIMTKPKNIDPVPTLDSYEKDKLTLCADKNDITCRTIAVCQKNTSAYCLGVNTLGFDGRNYYKFKSEEVEKLEYLKYSYFCYKSTLEAKRNDIEEETGQRILEKCTDPDSKYKDDKICEIKEGLDTANDPQERAKLQLSLDTLLEARGRSKNLTGIGTSIVERSNEINKEIKNSKAVLDGALEAYSQLQMAWKMHVKYIDIFNALVKYRDALVEIRKQTDQFPDRFIDATTTRCT